MHSDRVMSVERPLDARMDVVAEVFRRILGPHEIGPNEIDANADFFALGGHSLLVIEAIGVLREHHGLSVPARQFFKDASVRGVAAACVPLSGAGEAEKR